MTSTHATISHTFSKTAATHSAISVSRGCPSRISTPALTSARSAESPHTGYTRWKIENRKIWKILRFWVSLRNRRSRKKSTWTSSRRNTREWRLFVILTRTDSAPNSHHLGGLLSALSVIKRKYRIRNCPLPKELSSYWEISEITKNGVKNLRTWLKSLRRIGMRNWETWLNKWWRTRLPRLTIFSPNLLKKSL